MGRTHISNVPFSGTAEQEKKLRAKLAEYRNEPGALMPALQEAQEIYGYLPIEVQKIIAEEMGASLEEVYGISTFYAQFALSPKGKHSVSVCLGTACYVKGSGDIMARLERELGLKDGETSSDGKFSLSSTRCVGCCGLSPVMTVDGEVFGKLVPDDVPKILAKYK